MADNIDFALNDHFYDFVDDWNYKFYFLVGGYGSSKSYHVAVKLIKNCLKRSEKLWLSERSLIRSGTLVMTFCKKLLKLWVLMAI